MPNSPLFSASSVPQNTQTRPGQTVLLAAEDLLVSSLCRNTSTVLLASHPRNASQPPDGRLLWVLYGFAFKHLHVINSSKQICFFLKTRAAEPVLSSGVRFWYVWGGSDLHLLANPAQRLGDAGVNARFVPHGAADAPARGSDQFPHSRVLTGQWAATVALATGPKK